MRYFLFIILTLSINAQEQIIPLSPFLNEIVYALGKGEQVVGNTDYCNYPKESAKVPKVGGYFSVNLEKILLLNPTIVLMENNNHKLNRQLKRLNIKTKMVKIDSLESIKKAIIELGELFNTQQKAEKIVTAINSSLQKIQGIVRDKKILIVFGANSSLAKNIFVAGKNLYFQEIIEISGNQNALQSNRKGQPVLNMENIIATNPDIVVILAPPIQKNNLTKKELIAPWLEIPINARKNNAIYVIDKEYSGIPSDRLVLFLEDFREILKLLKN